MTSGFDSIHAWKPVVSETETFVASALMRGKSIVSCSVSLRHSADSSSATAVRVKCEECDQQRWRGPQVQVLGTRRQGADDKVLETLAHLFLWSGCAG